MSQTWKVIIAVAAVLFVFFLFFSGYVAPGLALLAVVVVLGLGALLYKGAGPPER